MKKINSNHGTVTVSLFSEKIKKTPMRKTAQCATPLRVRPVCVCVCLVRAHSNDSNVVCVMLGVFVYVRACVPGINGTRMHSSCIAGSNRGSNNLRIR